MWVDKHWTSLCCVSPLQIDVPSHASGFAPLIPYGVQFCDGTNTQLYNDPANDNTLKVVSNILAAVSDVFPDALFHLGGDETKVVNFTACTYDAIHAFEEALQVRRRGCWGGCGCCVCACLCVSL